MATDEIDQYLERMKETLSTGAPNYSLILMTLYVVGLHYPDSHTLNIDKIHMGILDRIYKMKPELFSSSGDFRRPKYILKNQIDADSVKNSEFFIIDFLHIRNPMSLTKVMIDDSFIGSPLGIEFDKMVSAINNNIPEAIRETTPLIPDSTGIAHRDAIQLIPSSIGKLDRYTGTRLSNVKLDRITIKSKGQLQGIFSSDGLLSNITIKNIDINTKSQHAITLCGLLNGVIDVKCGVSLYPLRIGGGHRYGNYNIVNFAKTSPIQYGTVKGVSRKDDKRQSVPDKIRHGRKYVSNFKLADFQKMYEIKLNGGKVNKFLAIELTMLELEKMKRIIIRR